MSERTLAGLRIPHRRGVSRAARSGSGLTAVLILMFFSDVGLSSLGAFSLGASSPKTKLLPIPVSPKPLTVSIQQEIPDLFIKLGPTGSDPMSSPKEVADPEIVDPDRELDFESDSGIDPSIPPCLLAKPTRHEKSSPSPSVKFLGTSGMGVDPTSEALDPEPEISPKDLPTAPTRPPLEGESAEWGTDVTFGAEVENSEGSGDANGDVISVLDHNGEDASHSIIPSVVDRARDVSGGETSERDVGMSRVLSRDALEKAILDASRPEHVGENAGTRTGFDHANRGSELSLPEKWETPRHQSASRSNNGWRDLDKVRRQPSRENQSWLWPWSLTPKDKRPHN